MNDFDKISRIVLKGADIPEYFLISSSFVTDITSCEQLKQTDEQ